MCLHTGAKLEFWTINSNITFYILISKVVMDTFGCIGYVWMHRIHLDALDIVFGYIGYIFTPECILHVCSKQNMCNREKGNGTSRIQTAYTTVSSCTKWRDPILHENVKILYYFCDGPI